MKIAVATLGLALFGMMFVLEALDRADRKDIAADLEISSQCDDPRAAR